MTKKWIFSLVLILFLQNLYSQHSVKGNIIDSSNNEALLYASVALLKDDSVVKAVLSDDNGRFQFKEVPSGNYGIRIKFSGYGDYINKNIQVNKDIELKNIALSPSSVMLKQFTLEDYRSLQEGGIDKRVFNITDDIRASSTSASEILEKIPMVNMDFDGNPEIVGKNGITILIDGRPPRFKANDLATTLRMIPANTIEKVEVMTNPPAKYSKDGNAVINIVTNLKRHEGYNLNIYGRVNELGGWGAGFNLNYKVKDFTINAYLGRWNWRNIKHEDQKRNNLTSETEPFFNSVTNLNNDYTGYYGGVGVNYDITDKSAVSMYMGYYPQESDNSYTSYNEIRDASNTIIDNFQRDNVSDNSGEHYNIGAEYQQKFNKPEQSLNINIDYSEEIGWKDDITNSFGSNDINSNYRLHTKQNSESNSLDISSDYFHPLDSTSNIEVGANYTDEYRRSIARQFVGENEVENTSYFTNFTIDETSYETYLSYSKIIKNTTLKVEGNYRSVELKMPTVTSKFNLFEPQFKVFQKINELHEIGFTYSYEAQVPWDFQLNPIINNENNRYISSGNPNLDAVRIHNFEFTHNTFIKNVSLGTTLFLNSSDNTIQNITTVDTNGVAFSTYENVGHKLEYGARFSSSFSIKKLIRFSLGASLFGSEIESNTTTTNAFSYSLNSNIFTRLPYGMTFRVGAFLNGPSVQADRKSKANFSMGIGLRKSFYKGLFNLSFGVRDVLNTRRYVQDFSNPTLEYNQRDTFYSRFWVIRANISLGKLKDYKRIKNAGGGANGV